MVYSTLNRSVRTANNSVLIVENFGTEYLGQRWDNAEERTEEIEQVQGRRRAVAGTSSPSSSFVVISNRQQRAGEEVVDGGQVETAAVDPQLDGRQLHALRSLLFSSFPPVLRLRGLRRGG